jgi:tripartite-type tricarboxylate transporter receptor subunit TctC
MLLVAAQPALAQAGAKAAGAYPARPVRIIVPLSPGGGVDILARIVGQHYHALWGQPFIVDNRPGAGGNIGYETVAKAQSDGYTLLVSASGIVTNAAVRESGYDPVRDFRAISKLTANPYVLVTTPSLPVSSVRDLIALAKAKPGQVTYGSAGIGSNPHLAAELFGFLAGVQITHVPYKGLSEAYPAVMSGTVNWVLGTPLTAMPLMRAGRLKGIAVTGAARSRTLPELPLEMGVRIEGTGRCVFDGLQTRRINGKNSVKIGKLYRVCSRCPRIWGRASGRSRSIVDCSMITPHRSRFCE